MRNVRIDNEAGAQETLFNWAQYQYARYPELELLYHIPNGGKRDARTAANLKRQGVKALQVLTGTRDDYNDYARALNIAIRVLREHVAEIDKKSQNQRREREADYESNKHY